MDSKRRINPHNPARTIRGRKMKKGFVPTNGVAKVQPAPAAQDQATTETASR